MQEVLPGARADHVAEQRLVLAADEAVGAAVLLVGPASGQVVARRQLVVDDRLIANRRADHGEAAAPQRVEEGVERFAFYDIHASPPDAAGSCRSEAPAR